MLGPTEGWYTCMTLLALIGTAVYFWRGIIHALGVVTALSFLAPVWCEISFLGLPFNVQTSAAILGLFFMAATAPWKIYTRIVWLDGVVAAMVVLQVAVDVSHGTQLIPTCFAAYGEWGLPYVAGRYALRDAEAAQLLAICICCVLIAMAILGFFDAITHINPWEVLFGERPEESFWRKYQRFGLRRSYGPTLHPIFFGLLVLALSPWPLALLRWAKTPGEKLLAVAGTASLSGVLACVSRTPLVGMLIFISLAGTIWWRWSRWLMVACTVGVLLLAFTDTEEIVRIFEKVGGETGYQQPTHILNGEEIEVSSASGRLLILKVFWPALKQAGWMGYGSAAVIDFPPRVPGLPKDDASRKRLGLVDNAFVLYGLRFGWLGALTFTTLFAVAAVTAFTNSWDRSMGTLSGVLGSMVIAMAISLLTVWFSYDMGFEVLWSMGTIGGLAAISRRN